LIGLYFSAESWKERQAALESTNVAQLIYEMGNLLEVSPLIIKAQICLVKIVT
jgi:hypothetical protein